ncbi:uncharacterized protein LOC9660991 [Selaginella moellendorffii]|uniref:uncharacterized protein LOC9660991 n=1 Tax=Selaginella moellendorffii TaxID=88036 RepID=UPI000D1C6439|nr:uncharacterized protein LOC9660991 [Selaginella moellendorffii]|eukprot:XP_024545862.1 uncharacterized protein LOC9660991 [Selaginella moellendorffii]
MANAIDPNFLALTAIITILYQGLFFAIAATFKFDKVTDFAGSTNFVLLAFLTAVINGTWFTRQIVLTLLVFVWGTRLAAFLLIRILKWGEDRRFDDKRNNLGAFAIFWIMQAAWVWTVSLPVTIANASDMDPPLEARDAIGWFLWICGIVIEMTSDYQKLKFKEDMDNRDKWCDIGFWSVSRHPNYFGEMLLWWGIFAAASPVFRGGQWAAIFGPLFLMAILLFLSGLPLLEASADKKYGSNPAYRMYKETTSPLIPFPPTKYAQLPPWVKKTFFFEFPIYSKHLGVVD